MGRCGIGKLLEISTGRLIDALDMQKEFLLLAKSQVQPTINEESAI